MFKVLVTLLLLNFSAYSIASPYKLSDSEYFKTIEVGYLLESRDGIKLFINVGIKKLVSATNSWTALIIFEGEGDHNFPLQIAKVITPLEQNLVVYTPHLFSIKNNQQYKVRVLAYENLTGKVLISEHEQLLYISAEDKVLNKFGINAL